jgi:hypothetical protein
MTAAKGFLIVVLSAVAFGIGGGLIGYSLGVFAPAYYRGVYRSGQEAWFDPVQMGLGLGISQGAVCGVIIGCVVVLAVAWYSSRRSVLDVSVLPRQAWQGSTREEIHSAEERVTRRQ